MSSSPATNTVRTITNGNFRKTHEDAILSGDLVSQSASPARNFPTRPSKSLAAPARILMPARTIDQNGNSKPLDYFNSNIQYSCSCDALAQDLGTFRRRLPVSETSSASSR